MMSAAARPAVASAPGTVIGRSTRYGCSSRASGTVISSAISSAKGGPDQGRELAGGRPVLRVGTGCQPVGAAQVQRTGAGNKVDAAGERRVGRADHVRERKGRRAQ